MRLADFILANIEPILGEWERFARGIWPGPATDPAELRDHAEDILRATARDMKATQTPVEQANKSKGKSDTTIKSSGMIGASEMHAVARVASGFALSMVVAEYRALRASVIRLWSESAPQPDVRDMKELTRFNEAIDQSLAEAVHSYTQRVSRSRQIFLAILGHDLRNPISAMKLNGQLLAHSGQLDAQYTALASSIPATATSMAALVDDLLDFTEAELAGALPVSPSRMDLGSLCKQVIGELQAAYPDRPMRFEGQGDLTGEWDGARLRQVVSNLLGNAIQHGGRVRESSPGGTDDAIEVSVSDEGSDVKLAVHNTGQPIPPQAQATIFDPLVRGERAAPKPGSIGLGLYITRAVVVAHGGTIDLTSSRKVGTTFTVRLPRHRQK